MWFATRMIHTHSLVLTLRHIAPKVVNHINLPLRADGVPLALDQFGCNVQYLTQQG